MDKVLWPGILILLLGLVALFWYLPTLVDQSLNQVETSPPDPVRPETEALHRRLFIADLHADSLLWHRDLLERHAYGHVDLPRLQEGNVALQVFGVVTKTPWGRRWEGNTADSDQITALAIAQAWPPRTWGSLLERALYQAAKLRELVSRSQGQLMMITHQEDLDRLRDRRQGGTLPVGALLGLEGAHALEGELTHLDRLYEAGFRLIGLAHLFDNQAAGSAHGIDKGGLTACGRALVRRIQERHMIVDLAHASPQVIDEILEMAISPVIASHTGVRGTCDNPRNLSDDHLRGIAATGGVIGIALFPQAVCGTTVADTARAIRYAVDRVGIDHVALGSDFDGAVTTPITASGWPRLTEALVDEGSTQEAIGKIMGGNVLRVLRQTLPRADMPGEIGLGMESRTGQTH